MKKIIILSIVIFILIICFIIFRHMDKEVVLVCNGDYVLIGSQANQEYTFEGINDYINKEKLEVRMFTNDTETVEEYYNIINSNSECSDIITDNDFISYTCIYDLVKDHYYEDLEDEDHKLRFDVIKKKFEEDNFICEYK